MNVREMYERWTSISLILRIVAGLVIGTVLALVIPNIGPIEILGSLFVGALKAIAPFLVFFLIVSSIARSGEGLGSRFKNVLLLYIGSTVIAAIVAALVFYAFPVEVILPDKPEDIEPVTDVWTLISGIIVGMVGNPLNALVNGNYLCILFWAAIIGFILRTLSSPVVKEAAEDISEIVSKLVRGIIQFAPFGILGLIYTTVSESGLEVFADYGLLIVVLVASMLIVMLITNPILGGVLMRHNPYPLLLTCLRESGVTAFFTRSSAANIPVNMALCEKLKLDPDFYSVSIPLGATINMNGAAVTITIMTMCAAFTLGMDVPIMLAIPLCLLATVAACGASGIAGGSLLLIPLACSFLGIDSSVAFQMVAIGYIIGVIQDSVETALNSSADVYFTSVAEVMDCNKRGVTPDFEFLK